MSNNLYDDNLEANLVKLAVNGDPTATKTLYDTYVHRIYQLVFYNTGHDQQLAEDITQDIFLSIFNSLAKFSGNSKLYTWIYRIALSKIADYHRKNAAKFRQGYQIEQIDVADLDLPSDEDITQEYEGRESFQSILGSLKQEYREVLYLKYIDNMSLKDIGGIMQRTTKAIEGLLDRAKSCLKEKYRNDNSPTEN